MSYRKIADLAVRTGTYTDRDGKRHSGFGLYEYMAIGPHHKYGFKDMLDGYEGN